MRPSPHTAISRPSIASAGLLRSAPEGFGNVSFPPFPDTSHLGLLRFRPIINEPCQLQSQRGAELTRTH